MPLGPCGFLFPGRVQPVKAGSRCLFSPIVRGAVGFSFRALRSGLVWPRCRVLLTTRLSVNLVTPLWRHPSPVADTPARARFGGWRKPARPCHSLPLAGVTGAPLVPLCWRCHTCQRLGAACPASPNPSRGGRLGLRLPAATAGALPPPPHPVGGAGRGRPAGGAGVSPARFRPYAPQPAAVLPTGKPCRAPPLRFGPPGARVSAPPPVGRRRDGERRFALRARFDARRGVEQGTRLKIGSSSLVRSA